MRLASSHLNRGGTQRNQLTPIDWARRPIEKYADFTGRAPRAEFWWYFLAVIVASIVARIIDNILGMNLAVPTGRSHMGIAAIFLLIGAACAILLLVFYCLAGTPGDNRYGPNPYGAGGGSTVAAE